MNNERRDIWKKDQKEKELEKSETKGMINIFWYVSVLVFQGCDHRHNLGGLKEETFIPSQSWKLEVGNR